MTRGLWQCQKGCKRWNAHIGRQGSKRVDTRCQYCSKRTAFKPHRYDRRGRRRSVHYISFPKDTPLEALKEARDGLNSALPTPTGPLVVDLDDEGIPTGFRKARDLI